MRVAIASLILASVCCSATRALAQDTTLLAACSEVVATEARLACFDREILPFTKRSATASPATPTSSASNSSASFGQEQLARANKPSVTPQESVLRGRITAMSQARPGTFLLTLDNDQVWRHENEHLGSYLRTGEAITIRRGTLGTYRLTRDAGDAKNWIRVTRVR